MAAAQIPEHSAILRKVSDSVLTGDYNEALEMIDLLQGGDNAWTG